MDAALPWIEPLLGIPLMLIVLADVFLTVLYARMGTSREAGLKTIADERQGFEIYASLRVKWDGSVSKLAEFMAVDAHLADPVGTSADSATERRHFADTRLHSAG